MKQILFLSLLLLLISCSKEDTETPVVNAQDYVGTWEYKQTTSSFEIRISSGPTAVSFNDIPAPGYTGYVKYSITSSLFTDNNLVFVALHETSAGKVVRECTCYLENKNTLKVLHVLKIDNTIRGSAELTFLRKL
jgi:hypothetical protein